MSELKGKRHENTACVFLTWTILHMEINNDFKKMSRGWQGRFYPPSLCRKPLANLIPPQPYRGWGT